MAACGPACIPRSQTQGEGALGQLTSSGGLAEATRLGISSSFEVGKKFALIHKLNSIFSKEDKKARSRGFALGEDIRAPLS